MSHQSVDRYSEGISSVASTLSTARSEKKKGRVGNLKKKSRQCACCKKYHVGACRRLTGGCYRCGDLGHHVRNCLKSSQAKRAIPGPTPTVQKPQRPHCPHCRKYHSGECRKLTGACYRCGDMEHKIRDCQGTLAKSNKP